MALENSDLHWPEQWRRLTQGDAKGVAWGDPIPTRTQLNGKTAEEIRFWAANCTAKIAFYLQKIPDDESQNDGYWEVRCFWHHKRKTWLLEQAALLQSNPTPTSKLPAVRALLPTSTRPNLGGWPGGQPVSFTNISSRESGSTEPGPIEDSVSAPSPTVLLEEVLAQPHWPSLDAKKMMQPFKRPREILASTVANLSPSADVTSGGVRRSARLKGKKSKLECDESLGSDEEDCKIIGF